MNEPQSGSISDSFQYQDPCKGSAFGFAYPYTAINYFIHLLEGAVPCLGRVQKF